MNTINEITETTQIIKKSVFTCTLIPVKTVEEANEQLRLIRKKYYDATHNCYSYVITDQNNNEIIKASDDGEPSQTAGVVILDVLKKNSLTNILAVVTRYFGGIKLGAGGLVRAYSSSTSDAIKNANIIPIIKMSQMTLTFDYSYVNEILKLFKDYKEVSNKYETNVTITFELPEEKIPSLKEKLISLTKNSIFITINN